MQIRANEIKIRAEKSTHFCAKVQNTIIICLSPELANKPALAYKTKFLQHAETSAVSCLDMARLCLMAGGDIMFRSCLDHFKVMFNYVQWQEVISCLDHV
jgi:hypothetical protein